MCRASKLPPNQSTPQHVKKKISYKLHQIPEDCYYSLTC